MEFVEVCITKKHSLGVGGNGSALDLEFNTMLRRESDGVVMLFLHTIQKS